ncbi:MAG TPA: tetratricopeptide repeat protein [Pyrinomonadaceae bacterium]|nr:tetratricopeptide repeat protein [Pyrinomonadaceae bacterium]
MKRSAVFLAIILCFLTFVPAQTSVWAKDKWVSVRSKNFFLIGNASEKEIRQVGTRLEQFREVFSRLFTKANFTAPVPTTVVVFKSDKSYGPFKPSPNLAGYFQPGQDVNYITLTTEVRGEQDPFTVIFHEYTHLLVNNNSGNVPTWFNEGLAEYYSTVSVTDDQKFVLGKPIGSHVYLLREKKMLPLRTLFQVDHQSPYYNEKDKQSVFYAQSWALMHLLILGKGQQRVGQMGKFLDSLSANVPVEKAFQQAFEMTFEQLEKELRDYIRNDRYPIMSGHFTEKVNFDKEMQSAPLSEAEAQAYLGDLLLHGNAAHAEGYLKKALELDPNLAMAHASMGMLRVREGKAAEARQSLEKAVAANSQNYLIHYYYAFALSREGSGNTETVTRFSPQNVERIREHLTKAIQLRPDFPESYSLLAFVNLVSRSNLDESVQMLKRALTTSPGRNDLVFMLAQVYMGKEDYKAARELLQKLSENNSDAELRQRAQYLLAQMATREEQLARYRESRDDPGSRPTLREPGKTDNPLRDPINSDNQPDVKVNTDPSVYLREALRKPAAGETQIQGLLVRIDCDAKGIMFTVKVGDALLKLTAKSFEHIDITSFSPEAGNEITCGPRKPENSVVVVYLPETNARAKTNGVAVSMEFVPKDFKLVAAQ